MNDSTLALADGRTLAYTDLGSAAEDAPIAVYFHGAPTSRLDLVPTHDELTDLGVRVVSADRPGYGGSSPRPGRSIADHTDDVVALADHLGIRRFAVVGLSSGGPYAVAAAALHPDRVTAVAVIAGVTDFGWDGAWDGYEPTEAELMRQPDEETAVRWASEHLGADGSGYLALDMAASEQAAMADEAFGTEVFATLLEGLKQGVDGFARDIWVQGQPWSFDPSSITAPTRVFRAELDGMVPAAHLEHTASLIPGAELTVWPGVAHVQTVAKVPGVVADLLR
jgi:pimeloyl-ACP methyl ester carboxylesterase